jgi:hypothetical protein
MNYENTAVAQLIINYRGLKDFGQHGPKENIYNEFHRSSGTWIPWRLKSRFLQKSLGDDVGQQTPALV